MGPDVSALLTDATLGGAAWCRSHAALIDAWLAGLFADADAPAAGVALVAVGGYGRGELCPQSDIDVYLVHTRGEVAAFASRLWYPIWDAGLHLGHSVTTVDQCLELAERDLDTATALLSARHIAGDEAITNALAQRAAEQWRRRSARALADLGARTAARHTRFGEVAFSLEPDLKEGRGGLRDVHGMGWLQAAVDLPNAEDEKAVAAAYETLLDARVELHRLTGRPANVLTLEDQDDVARALGETDADGLMASIADASGRIAWTSDDAWRRSRRRQRGPLGRLRRREHAIEPGISLRDGEVAVAEGGGVLTALRAAAAAATHHTVIARASLELLAREAPPLPDPWPDGALDLFVQLLRAGKAARPVIEGLDQRDVWTRIIPEWEQVRARPQRNPYHRYTVDRHLLEAVSNAAAMGGPRPDVLVLAALLHDLGKGGTQDHVVAGTALARSLTSRMGVDADDAATVVVLVEHHLLLADTATRRDLDDPSTIQRVAAAVGSTENLHLLATLTEADSIATGVSAWTPWKAALVGELVDRVDRYLADPDGEGPARVLRELDLSIDRIEAEGDTLTVVTRDRPGVFSRVAGVLALRGLDVLCAAAYSTDDGRAVSRFQVAPRDPLPWDRVRSELALALEGRLAVSARLAERERMYSRSAHPAGGVTVTFDVDASSDATVIDVHAPDRIGVLYRITRALADLDLDIRSARVQTLGSTVVDAFYVRDRDGHKLDASMSAEVERAILHGLGSSRSAC